MCLTLSIDKFTRKRNDGKLQFLTEVDLRPDGLVILEKWVVRTERGTNLWGEFCTNYETLFRSNLIRLGVVTYSDRPTKFLTKREWRTGSVEQGLHFYVDLPSHVQCRLFAVVHLDDCVAYDDYNHVVFMRAIYCEERPSEEDMKKYAKMLKENKCQNNQ